MTAAHLGGSVVNAISGLGAWVCFYPVRWTAGRLPARPAMRLGDALGAAHARFLRDSTTRRIRAGIRTVWGEASAADVQRLVRRNLMVRYRDLLDTFRYGRYREAVLAGAIGAVEGTEHLDRARGGILLLAHFGSPVMLLAALAARGHRLHVVLAERAGAGHHAWAFLHRSALRAKLSCWQHERVTFELWRGGAYLRSLYRRLQGESLVVLYGDAIRSRRFVAVEFLGQSLLLPTGPFRLAATTAVPLFPAFIVRDADGRYRVVVESPLTVEATPTGIAQAAQAWADLLGRYVSAYPDHWFTWARLRRTTRAGRPWLELTTDEGGAASPEVGVQVA
jgi:KDO2-lipid IV(A) lauroyltransferase